MIRGSGPGRAGLLPVKSHSPWYRRICTDPWVHTLYTLVACGRLNLNLKSVRKISQPRAPAILLATALRTPLPVARFGNGAEKARKCTVTKPVPDAMAARKKSTKKATPSSEPLSVQYTGSPSLRLANRLVVVVVSSRGRARVYQPLLKTNSKAAD
jgi:hypothetical protein